MRIETKIVATRNQLPIKVTKTALIPAAALDGALAKIDDRQGIILSSGFDYPGRHSRWDIAFIQPAVEFSSKENRFYIEALNKKGEGIVSLLAPIFTGADYLEDSSVSTTLIKGTVRRSVTSIAEEFRSKEPSIFSAIRDLVHFFRVQDPCCAHFGLYGALGYDLIQQFEKLNLRLLRDDGQKDCRLFLPLELVVADRQKEKAYQLNFDFDTPLGNTMDLSGGGQTYNRVSSQMPTEVISDHRLGEFAKKVERVMEGTKRGDYFEVVLSQTFSTPYASSPKVLFNKLAEINPSPYMFLMNFGDEQLVGSSPEIYARITGRLYETCPIAGTIRRGDSALEDADRVKELIASLKDESELTMCTDVDRNDMARVCVPGSVKVIGRRQLEFYSHLIHTVDHLQGTLALGFDSLDALQTHMWACTVTGAPKPAAMQEIENLENSPRAWYSGAVGLIAFNGDLNMGITIRTAHLKGGLASIRAGATLLYGSDPESEEQETRTKAQAFLHTLTAMGNKKTSPVSSSYPFTKIGQGKKILLVDYHDSFVHNLAGYLRCFGADVITLRAGFDESRLDEIRPHLVLLSPGPGTPSSFRIANLIEKLIARRLPIFGVCLGHQAIGEYFGAKLSQLPLPVHGKETFVCHTGNSILAGLPERFVVGRYHSLYLEQKDFPEQLEILAVTEVDNATIDAFPVIMALKHKELPIASVQFHPESIMSLKADAGYKIINNVLEELVGQ